MTTVAVVGWFEAMPEPDEIARAIPDDRIVRFDSGGSFDGAEDIEVAFAAPRPELIRGFAARAPRLRWLHTVSAGVEHFLAPELVGRPGFTLTNNSGPWDVPIAELVLATMLSAAKHLPDYQRAQQQARWAKDLRHSELRGATVVILGLGSIGGEVARLAHAFGMRVIGVRRRLDLPGIESVNEIVPPQRLAEIASEADYLVVAAPLTSATRGLVSAEVIARMKKTAWLVNIARGPIVDEAALHAALTGHLIAGAAIDAWWTEPIPPDSDWWRMENVIVTPHVSGRSPHIRERTLALFVENLRRWKAGEPLLNVVDPAAGY